MDPDVSAAVCLASSQYYKYVKDFAQFYKSSLLSTSLTGCTHVKNSPDHLSRHCLAKVAHKLDTQVDPDVSAAVCLASSQYYKYVKDFAQFYKSSLLYLAFVSTKDLDPARRQVHHCLWG